MWTVSQKKYSVQDNDLLLDNDDRRYVLKVKDLSEEDRPREKLLKFGPEALASAELLAIVLTVGTKKEEVLSLASRVLKEYGEKNVVNQKDPKVLEEEFDVPFAKACQIVACFELGRRFFRKVDCGPTVIRTARQAYEYLKDMRNLPKEHFRGLYLNSRYRLVYDEVISVGSLTANIVHPREVFRPALERSAAAIIVAHNHPSGSVKPTESDIEVTKKLIAAGKLLGIDVLDHLIVTKNRFASILGVDN